MDDMINWSFKFDTFKTKHFNQYVKFKIYIYKLNIKILVSVCFICRI